jgi:hypothetical protein
MDANELDVADILARAARARAALVNAVAALSDAAFLREDEDWSPARILRHVVWVEHYWTAIMLRACAHRGDVLDLDETLRLELARDASRLAGTPPEPLPAPPPFDSRGEALPALEASRMAFESGVRSLPPEYVRKRVVTPRGVVSVRFSAEHVIEHDWDHAVQVTSLR